MEAFFSGLAIMVGFLVGAAAAAAAFGWCRLGLHRWDMPGGHCEECGACDEFFGPHEGGRLDVAASKNAEGKQ